MIPDMFDFLSGNDLMVISSNVKKWAVEFKKSQHESLIFSMFRVLC